MSYFCNLSRVIKNCKRRLTQKSPQTSRSRQWRCFGLQINCSSPAKKLKLDKLPGGKSFCRTPKTFARKLENEEKGGQNFQKFSCRTQQYLPGSLKGRKLGQIFSKIFL